MTKTVAVLMSAGSFGLAWLCGAAMAQNVQVWELPKGEVKLDAHEGWKAGSAGAAAKAGAALENKFLVVVAQPGAAGVTIHAKTEGGPGPERVEMALLAPSAANAENISKVRIGRAGADEGSLHVTAGAAEAEIVLGPADAFAECRPGKGAASLEVRCGARYALLPDFFADDVIYDPTQFAAPKLNVPAENFLVQLTGGGNAIAMCVWRGTLTATNAPGAAAKPASREEAKDPQVDLFFSGEGVARRVGAARIEWLGKPMYIGLLAQTNIWHDENVSEWPAQKPKAIEWKRPFDAKWRADFLVAPGKKTSDWNSRGQSFPFWGPYSPALKVPKGTVDAVLTWVPSLKEHIYPCWFVTNDTRICLYADLKERWRVAPINEAERKAAAQAKKEGKEYTPKPEIFPSNVYERVIIYPLDRDTNTPLTVFTLVDVMRETLGQGPCEYVLDLEGVKPQPAGGKRELLAGATCALWMEHVFYVMCKMKKNPDGTYVPLEPKLQERLMQALDDMRAFVHAVHDRLRGYKKFAQDTLALCEAESKRAPQVKSVADGIRGLAMALSNDVRQLPLEGPQAGDNKWDGIIQGILDEVKTNNYANVGKAGGIRDLGDNQDNMVSRCRRYVKGIRQEASLADTSDPEVRKFAAEMRERSHQMLRKKHHMEGP